MVLSEKEIEVLRDESPINADGMRLFDYYDIETTLSVIEKQEAKQVALQFPDEMLSDSFYVFNVLLKHVPSDCQVYVLGDTSYNPCCVDVVAANHIDSDLIIHYGDTCLSEVSSPAVYNVYGKKQLDIDTICGAFGEISYKLSGTVYLCYDACYAHLISTVEEQLKQQYSEIVVGQLPTCQNLSEKTKAECSLKSIDEYKSWKRLGSNFFEQYNSQLNKYILYLGENEKANLTVLMDCALSTVYSFNIDYQCWKVDMKGRKEIMSRYVCIERAKESTVFGIIAGTLSTTYSTLIINHIKNILYENEKSCYVLSVGKINYPKLANLPGIDTYVLVGCPRSIFLNDDDTELKSLNIITPFDLEIAFEKREWTGEYILDNSLLVSEKDNILLSTPKKLVEKKEKSNDEVLYIPTPSSELVEFHSSALDLIQEKHYTGLQQNENAEISSIQEGKKGIAWEYTSEYSIEGDDELF